MFLTIFQHHISKLSRYFSSLWSDEVSALYEPILQIKQLTSFVLKFRSNFLVPEFYLVDAAFAMEILGLISGTPIF